MFLFLTGVLNKSCRFETYSYEDSSAVYPPKKIRRESSTVNVQLIHLRELRNDVQV